jgi:FHA domain
MGGMQQPGMGHPPMQQQQLQPQAPQGGGQAGAMQQPGAVPYGAGAAGSGYPPAAPAAAGPAAAGYYPGAAPTPAGRPSQPDRVSTTGAKIVGFLVSFETNDQGDFWVLRSGQLRVGRKDSADGLAVAIDHPTVSSSHAVLTIDPEAQLFQIEDTRSANGTVLNGRAISGLGARELRDGDRVRFGGFSATLKLLG